MYICHYNSPAAFINISTMFRQEYAHFAIFEGLNPQQIQALSPFLEEVRYPSGTVIFQQGNLADALCIVLEGEVQIRYKPYDGPSLVVARISPGGVCGWSAVLGRDVYTSSAVAKTDVVAYRLKRACLQTLCERNPDLGRVWLERLASVIAERLRNTHISILEMLTTGMEMQPTSEGCQKQEG